MYAEVLFENDGAIGSRCQNDDPLRTVSWDYLKVIAKNRSEDADNHFLCGLKKKSLKKREIFLKTERRKSKVNEFFHCGFSFVFFSIIFVKKHKIWGALYGFKIA